MELPQIDLAAWQQRFARRQFNAKARLAFYRQLALYQRNNKALYDSLEKTMELLEVRDYDHPLATAIRDWLPLLAAGQPLSKATAGWIPDQERMIIAAGENTAHLDQALLTAARTLEKRGAMTGALFAAMAYPVLLSAFGLAMLIGFHLKLAPILVSTLQHTPPQGGLAFMLGFSGQVYAHLPSLLAAPILLITLVTISLSRLRGRVRDYADRIPPWSVNRVVSGTDFMLSLATLFKTGMALDNAMHFLAEQANPYVRERLRDASEVMAAGKNIGEAFLISGHRWPSDAIINDMVVLADMQGFETALEDIANTWLDATTKRVQKWAGILNGVALGMIAVLAMLFLWAIFSFQQMVGSGSFIH